MASDSKQRITLRTGARAATADSSRSSSCPSEPLSIRQARQTANRLYEIEQDLVRRIVENYETDRQLRTLLVELQICSSRVRAQIEDCAAGCQSEPSADCATAGRNDKNKR